jgi:hypothetical protein
MRGRRVTPVRTATSTTGSLPTRAITAAVVAVALALLLSGPATAFVDETPDEGADETTEEPAAEREAADDEGEGERPGGDGFVGDRGDTREAPPVGGVDAGFGGGVTAGGPGALHAVAVSLLLLALAGHAANARRGAVVRG